MQISAEVLVATARVQAALNIFPHIIGLREVWLPWFRDSIKQDSVCMQTPNLYEI